jgi:hypothetical protein
VKKLVLMFLSMFALCGCVTGKWYVEDRSGKMTEARLVHFNAPYDCYQFESKYSNNIATQIMFTQFTSKKKSI